MYVYPVRVALHCLCSNVEGDTTRMTTKSLAVGDRLHHLKIVFSNSFVYAQVLRRTDNHVSCIRLTRRRDPIRASLGQP